MRDYEIISTDSHLEVPPYAWEPSRNSATTGWVATTSGMRE